MRTSTSTGVNCQRVAKWQELRKKLRKRLSQHRLAFLTLPFLFFSRFVLFLDLLLRYIPFNTKNKILIQRFSPPSRYMVIHCAKRFPVVNWTWGTFLTVISNPERAFILTGKVGDERSGANYGPNRMRDAIRTAVQKRSFSQRIQKFVDFYLADGERGPTGTRNWSAISGKLRTKVA